MCRPAKTFRPVQLTADVSQSGGFRPEKSKNRKADRAAV
jgi:hypothetical protein